MGREFELKYRTDRETLAAIREKFSGFVTIAMETAYYDTPNADLSRRRWTLRRRLENGRSVCTVKTPRPDGSRGEWETENDSIEAAVPELCKLGAPTELAALVASGISQVCAARFTRLAATLKRPGCVLELALDQGSLLGGGREQPFAEVEVELKSGSELAAVAFAHGLALRFRLEPEHASKVQRAMALAGRG